MELNRGKGRLKEYPKSIALSPRFFCQNKNRKKIERESVEREIQRKWLPGKIPRQFPRQVQRPRKTLQQALYYKKRDAQNVDISFIVKRFI